MDKRSLIPDHEQYQKILTIFSEHDSNKHLKCFVAVRLGCEMGLSRLEIVNLRVSDIDRFHKRGLWVEIAKKVKRGSKFEMRQREIPMNPNLYLFIKTYVDKNQQYILRREKGEDWRKPFIPRYINTLYDDCAVPWSPHKSRHYFKNRVADWMRDSHQVDLGLIKELMGHKKTVTEDYGSYSWDYKRDVIDKVIW